MDIGNIDNSSIENLQISESPASSTLDTGLNVRASDNLLIQNNSITDRNKGINISFGSEVRVLNNDVSNASGTALTIASVGSTATLPERIEVSGNLYTGSVNAVSLQNMSDQTISDGSIAGSNVILENSSGLATASGTALNLLNIDDSSVSNLDVTGPGAGTSSKGIDVRNSDRLVIEDNDAAGRSAGIILLNGRDVDVLNNNLVNSWHQFGSDAKRRPTGRPCYEHFRVWK